MLTMLVDTVRADDRIGTVRTPSLHHQTSTDWMPIVMRSTSNPGVVSDPARLSFARRRCVRLSYARRSSWSPLTVTHALRSASLYPQQQMTLVLSRRVKSDTHAIILSPGSHAEHQTYLSRTGHALVCSQQNTYTGRLGEKKSC